MTEKCFDEGTIQAFLDGELETDRLEAVARHTAVCQPCAFLLTEAEEESALAFSAIGDEYGSLVPTERIRTNLYAAIGQLERPKKSFWQKLFGDAFSFSNPSLVAFASLLLVFGVFTTLYIHRESTNSGANPNQIAQSSPSRTAQPTRSVETIASNPTEEPQDKVQAANAGEDDEPAAEDVPKPTSRRGDVNQPKFEKAIYRGGRDTDEAQVARIGDKYPVRPQSSMGEILPGEESYVKTITTLTENVNSRKDTVLRPSERVAFEKDLAVVNDAIKKTRQEVRRNPRNEAAKQVLRSSYQNKIDLLNSVAERSELMATIR